MGQISTTVEIPATPEQVWQVISTPATYEQWLTIHTKWKGNVPETFSHGASASEVVTMLGMPNTITWTVDEFESPSRMSISGTGMAGVKVAFGFVVEADGNGGSRASVNAVFEGQMIAGALGKAVEKDGLANLEQSLAKLADLIGT
jgi:uncharacterized protein YndB with AHSA1/START domain